MRGWQAFVSKFCGQDDLSQTARTHSINFEQCFHSSKKKINIRPQEREEEEKKELGGSDFVCFSNPFPLIVFVVSLSLVQHWIVGCDSGTPWSVQVEAHLGTTGAYLFLSI